MDRPSAEDSAPVPVTGKAITASRRHLFMCAGLVGAAYTLTPSDSSAAQIKKRPNIPTEADAVLLTQAMILEITARDLYERRLKGGSNGVADVINVISENHRAYAEAIAGTTGISLVRGSESIYEANVAVFEGDEEDFLIAAHSLEQSAVATHTSLLDRYESVNAINLTASILVIEARHATVIADLLGVDVSARLDNTGMVIPSEMLEGSLR